MNLSRKVRYYHDNLETNIEEYESSTGQLRPSKRIANKFKNTRFGKAFMRGWEEEDKRIKDREQKRMNRTSKE